MDVLIVCVMYLIVNLLLYHHVNYVWEGILVKVSWEGDVNLSI